MLTLKSFLWRTGHFHVISGFTFLLEKLFIFLFLLSVEGLGFFICGFFSQGEVAFFLVSRLRDKVEPRAREKEMVCIILASAWHKSRHCVNRAGSPPIIVMGAILTD